MGSYYLIFVFLVFLQHVIGDEKVSREYLRKPRNIYKEIPAPPAKSYEPAAYEIPVVEDAYPRENSYDQNDQSASQYQPAFQAKFQTSPYQSSFNYQPYSSYPTQTQNYNLFNYKNRVTLEQWCTDACARRGSGGYKKVDLSNSPNSYQFPSINGLPQSFDDMNCRCLCPVPLEQDPEYKLCNNHGDTYNTCKNFCLGFLHKKPVNIVGSNATYHGGECIEGSGCNCHCKVYNIPIQ